MKIANIILKEFKTCTIDTLRNPEINTQGKCNHYLGSARDQHGLTQTIKKWSF